MENLPAWVVIIVTFITTIGGGAGAAALLGYFKPKAQSPEEKKSIEAQTDKTTIEGLQLAFETLHKNLNAQIEQLRKQLEIQNQKIEKQQVELQRLVGMLREKDDCIERAKKMIQELVERFHALRNEFYEELERWPIVGLPDGLEEYEE